jgi:N-formylglutamate amidohydrolase
MHEEQTYSLKAIEQRLADNDLPFSGRTELGSAYFTFLRPSFCCATAIHASSQIRDELHPKLKISPEDRLREEDPGTDWFLENFPIRITALDSRYEYDINRATARAIYDVAWGVEVWEYPPSEIGRKLSLAKHAEFHKLMDIVAEYLIRDNNYGIIFDLHSFNYRRTRGGENTKPDINIGTRPVNRGRFGDLIDNFISRLKEITINGNRLRVAENEIFSGGYLSRQLSSKYYDKILVLAIEFKKIYMDEWTGEIFERVLEELVDKFNRATEEITIKFFTAETQRKK